MGEAHARPAAMVLVRHAGLEQREVADADPVYRQFGQHVREQAADQDGQVGHADLGVLLDEVALQLVRGPAHRRASLRRPNQPLVTTTNVTTKAGPTIQLSIAVRSTTPSRMRLIPAAI